MRGQRYTAEQLAASAAAGDPREESEFSDRAAFQRWQDEWFSVVTMGETLPQVGDPNRAKRWKATRRQRKAIEEQRQFATHMLARCAYDACLDRLFGGAEAQADRRALVCGVDRVQIEGQNFHYAGNFWWQVSNHHPSTSTSVSASASTSTLLDVR